MSEISASRLRNTARRPRFGRSLWAFALVVWLMPGGAFAAGELPEPRGRVILTVSGNVSVTNSAGGAAFDRAMLEAMPQVTIRTATPWIEGEAEFRGPLVRDVLARACAQGEQLVAHAINDYIVNIPRADVERFGQRADVPVECDAEAGLVAVAVEDGKSLDQERPLVAVLVDQSQV